MMKSENVLCFAIGAVIGGVVTYYATKQKFERQAQEDINEMREAMQKEYKATITDAITDAVDNLNELAEQKQESDLFREYDPHKTEYQKIRVIGHDDAAVIVEPDPEIDEAEKEYPREEPAELPYTITPDDFANTMRIYDKVSVDYYDDGALINESGDTVDPDLVGIINLTQFRTGKTEDPNWMYVRNERIGVDFEVQRIYHKYGDDLADGS